MFLWLNRSSFNPGMLSQELMVKVEPFSVVSQASPCNGNS